MRVVISVLPAIGFIAAVGGHAAFHVRSVPACEVVCTTDCPPVDNERGLERYLAEQDYMLGMSYGTAVAFTVYAASR